MHSMKDFDLEHAASSGLRERKQRATRISIEIATLSLVLEKGYGGATIEEICQNADVSMRTFFNYFPSKDDAVIGMPSPDVDEEWLLSSLFRNESDSLLDTVLVTLIEVTSQDPSDVRVERLRKKVLATYPDLMYRHMKHFFEMEKTMREALAVYLTKSPDKRIFTGELQESEEALLVIDLATTLTRWAFFDAIAQETVCEEQTVAIPSLPDVKKAVLRAARIIQEDNKKTHDRKRKNVHGTDNHPTGGDGRETAVR